LPFYSPDFDHIKHYQAWFKTKLEIPLRLWLIFQSPLFYLSLYLQINNKL
jgi:hypothetical protein